MKYNYVLDGRNGFFPTIKALTSVSFRIRVEATSSYDLAPNSDHNFQTSEFFNEFDFK